MLSALKRFIGDGKLYKSSLPLGLNDWTKAWFHIWRMGAFRRPDDSNETMNTIEQLRHALGLANERELKGSRFINIPTRRRAKELKKSFRRNARESQADSMLNMGKPPGHKTLPRFPSERDKTLFAAHMRRKESGWVRG